MKKILLILSISGIVFISCKNKKVDPDCSSLAFTTVNVNEICSGANGSITISAVGGNASYTYSKDNGASFQTENLFSNLEAGTYDVVVKDENLCEIKSSVILTNEVGNLDFTFTTIDAGCGTSVGEVAILATGGDGNYTYSVDGFNFETTNKFTSLVQNTYTVSVKDGKDCSTQKSVSIKAGNISYTTDIVPIVMASCGVTNCHDGSNSSRTNLNNYTTLKNNKASSITKLKNASMPQSPGTISAANKVKLLCWLNDGAPNN